MILRSYLARSACEKIGVPVAVGFISAGIAACAGTFNTSCKSGTPGGVSGRKRTIIKHDF